MTADQSFLESPLKHVISPLVAPVGNMKRISDGVLTRMGKLARDCALIPCKKNIMWGGFKTFAIFGQLRHTRLSLAYCASSRSIKTPPPQKKKKKK